MYPDIFYSGTPDVLIRCPMHLLVEELGGIFLSEPGSLIFFFSITEQKEWRKPPTGI